MDRSDDGTGRAGMVVGRTPVTIADGLFDPGGALFLSIDVATCGVATTVQLHYPACNCGV